MSFRSNISLSFDRSEEYKNCFIIISIINLYLYTKSYHFYRVFLGIVCKIRLKYSKELLDYKVKNRKTYIINNKSYNESWCIKIIFPMHEMKF